MSNNKTWLVTVSLAYSLMVSAALAQQPAPPPIPQFDPSQPFNPSNPFVSQPIQPIQPQQVPLPQAQQQRQGAANLPLPEDKEMFDFFQPGYQLDELPEQEPTQPIEEAIEIEAPEEETRRVRRLPLDRFNYRKQRLPETIYKKEYESRNRHLPRARYPDDYDRAAFSAAAANNLDALRALVNAGRDINMRNAHGETLVMVATRHNAHDTLRYLLAKGAETGQAERIAAARRDGLSFYAIQSAR